MISDSKKWETDAGNISDYSNFDKFVYRNSSINEFLNNSGKYFVIAAKGIGKTLLLSYKRYLLEKKYISDNNSSSVIFIPNHHPYISFIESIKTTLSKDYISKFKEWEYCKRIWVLVIELAALSYFEIDIDNFLLNLPERAQRKKNSLRNFLRVPNSVEYIFNELLNFGESSLTQFVNDVSNYISAEFSSINKSIVIFIDRLDNALETSHDEIWQPIQTGLLEAAWDVMRTCHHVKVYLSIRQEAYAAHRSRNLNAISATVVEIKYSNKELRELLNHLVKFYEKNNTIEDMLGFDSFPNTVTYKNENVFEFMLRYSIYRPRDFVQFCCELSKTKDALYGNLDDKRMAQKEEVRRISSNVIVYSLFEELRMILDCLTTQERFDRFLTLLKRNIISYSEMKMICREFNEGNCSGICQKCPRDQHPFCDLFNMGLLGLADAPGIDIQKFKKPYEKLTKGLNNSANFFLIHPALREYINELHRTVSATSKYDLYTGILVGEGVLWSDNYRVIYSVNRLIDKLNDRVLSDIFREELIRSIKQPRSRLLKVTQNQINNPKYPLYKQRIIDVLIEYFKKRTIPKLAPISIFISYAFDNQAHKEKVESFVDLLRTMGFDAQMDSSLKTKYQDLDQMMIAGLKMDKIIIILSEEYKRKADNAIGGVWKEFKMIVNDLNIHSEKYIFVCFKQFSEELRIKVSPLGIGNRWIVDLMKGKKDNYCELVSFIKEEKEYPFSTVNDVAVDVSQRIIKPF